MKTLLTNLAACVARATAAAFAQLRKLPPIAQYVGAFVPTADQRDVLDDAHRAGLRLSPARAVQHRRSAR